VRQTQQVTVADVVEALGPHLVVAAHGDLSLPVLHVQTTDPAYPQQVEAGSLLLAPGFVVDSPAWDDLVAACTATPPAAVLVKGQAALPGVATLVLDPGADWGQLSTLIRTALAGVGPQEGLSMFDLADAVAGLCQGPVVIHDAQWQLLAYSGDQPLEQTRSETILGRRAPREFVALLTETGVVARLQAGEAVHVAAGTIEGLSERWAVGVRVGADYLGSIWLLPPAADPDVVRESMLRASEVAALPFLRHASTSRAHDEAFAGLLTGGTASRAVAERLGVAADTGFVLAGLRPLASDGAERLADARRLQGHVQTYFDAYRSTASVAAVGDTVYLLIPSPDLDARGRAVRLLTDLHTRLSRLVPHRALLSGRFNALVETAPTRSVVDELLSLSERRGWSSLTDSEQVQASWRLEQFREVALAHPGLLQGPVMKVVEYDHSQGGDLLPTLRAWFQSVGDARRTADSLGLHVNTVRYRLRRVEEIAGISLDDPDERLLAELQVRLLLGD
jgi:hypothetical protein